MNAMRFLLLDDHFRFAYAQIYELKKLLLLKILRIFGR